MKSKKLLRKMLVTALRSGLYEQGMFSLHYRPKEGKGKFCCLGVACDITDPHGWKPEKKPTSQGITYEFDDDTCFLPDTVRRKYGFTNKRGEFKFDSLPAELQERIRVALTKNDVTYNAERYTEESLFNLNDLGLPFDIIADIIEAEPKGMFSGK